MDLAIGFVVFAGFFFGCGYGICWLVGWPQDCPQCRRPRGPKLWRGLD